MKPTRIPSREPFTFFPLRGERVGSSCRFVNDNKISVSLEWRFRYEIVFNMFDAWEIYCIDVRSFNRGSFEKNSVGIISDLDLVRFLNWVVLGDTSRLSNIADHSLHGNFLSAFSSVIRIYSNTYGVGYVQERILL